MSIIRKKIKSDIKLSGVRAVECYNNPRVSVPTTLDVRLKYLR